jgi:hypothetical protein
VVDVVSTVWAFAGGFGARDEDPSAVESFDFFVLDEAGVVVFDWECTNAAPVRR